MSRHIHTLFVQIIMSNICNFLAVAYLVRENVCGQHDDIFFSQLLSTSIFMCGVTTVAQVTLGVR